MDDTKLARWSNWMISCLYQCCLCVCAYVHVFVHVCACMCVYTCERVQLQWNTAGRGSKYWQCKLWHSNKAHVLVLQMGSSWMWCKLVTMLLTDQFPCVALCTLSARVEKYEFAEMYNIMVQLNALYLITHTHVQNAQMPTPTHKHTNTHPPTTPTCTYTRFLCITYVHPIITRHTIQWVFDWLVASSTFTSWALIVLVI